MLNDNQPIATGDRSRRSFLKKSALASSAVALGAASGGTAAAESALQDQQPGQALVFAYDYNPGLTFQAINRLQQQTVNAILGQTVGENGDQVVTDPTDYNGYIVQYQAGEGAVGEYTLVFVRNQTLSTDQSYQFTAGDVTYFDSSVNLLQAGLSTGGNEGG